MHLTVRLPCNALPGFLVSQRWPTCSSERNSRIAQFRTWKLLNFAEPLATRWRPNLRLIEILRIRGWSVLIAMLRPAQLDGLTARPTVFDNCLRLCSTPPPDQSLRLLKPSAWCQREKPAKTVIGRRIFQGHGCECSANMRRMNQTHVHKQSL